MSLKDQTTLRVVLYEGSGSQPLESQERFAALTALLERGYTVTRTTGGGRVAQHDRAAMLVLGLFENGHAPQAEDASGAVALRFQDLAGFDANRIAEFVESARAETQ